MATYEFPTIAQLQSYGRGALAYPGQAPMTTGAPVAYAPGVLNAPRGAGKPRLRLMNNGEIRIKGVDDAAVFFAPLNPLQPVAQTPAAQGVRPWDYPVGWNTRVTPRTGYAVSFPTLKALAEGFDVLRILIERVKDKIVTRPWSIQPLEKAEKNDPRCEGLEEFFASPDREHSWQDWARMLLEQVIVYDAPALYLRSNRRGELYSCEVWDGSLITPKIMADGRLPPPDMGPAYQQVLKGLPAVDWIKPVPRGQPVPTDPAGNPFPELLYKPRNPRVDSPYGFSPVEQIITTINIALRQEHFLLSFYTDGSRPDSAFTTPSTWTTQDIANFKVWWDSVLAGNLDTRRGTMFLPDGAKIIDFKEGALQDRETVEWLTRVMCFALGLNPMPFIRQMNRGQEKTHHDEAQQEGLEPWQHWFTDLINTIIRLKFGWTDLTFRWEEDDPTDPVEQATIDKILVDAKIYHPDERRAKRGDDAMPDDLRAQMDMATFNAAQNSTVLSPEQQAERDQHAVDLAASRPAPFAAPAAAAQKSEPVVNHFNFDAPQITVSPPAISIAPAAINVTAPPVTVNLPEMKAADVFVDVGATNVKVDAPQARAPTLGKTVTAQMIDGKMVGTITDGVKRTVTRYRDAGGKTVTKIEE